MKNSGLVGVVIGSVISIAVLSVTVFYASKAWKKGQTGQKLI